MEIISSKIVCSSSVEKKTEGIVFIAYKPFQFFYSVAVANFLSDHVTIIIVEQNFGLDVDYLIGVCRGFSWFGPIRVQRVKCKENIEKFSLRNKSLYVPDERCSMYEFYMRFQPAELNVYEEGSALYGFPLNLSFLGLIKWTIKGFFSGCGILIGHGQKVRNIYCTYPKLYLKTSKLGNKKNVHEVNVLQIFRDLTCLYDFKCKPDIGVVTVISLGWNPERFRQFLSENQFRDSNVFVKPHPHCKEKPNWMPCEFIFVADTIPVEILIFYLISKGVKVHFYHDSSSSVLYLKNLRNVIKLEDFGKPSYLKRRLKELCSDLSSDTHLEE